MHKITDEAEKVIEKEFRVRKKVEEVVQEEWEQEQGMEEEIVVQEIGEAIFVQKEKVDDLEEGNWQQVAAVGQHSASGGRRAGWKQPYSTTMCFEKFRGTAGFWGDFEV